ncbi:DUF2332 family protein [Brevundimonas terrae]|uniref:DUF2332 family protein n=1 Tax=Brevundimonas terrae TaxID=363631 RepID=A0ABN0YJ50_9CAUL|nr:DUF2332 family protein [Brevundimonas terrae]NIJ27178.1 hypothetical protein [Brevundimonas terrae]
MAVRTAFANQSAICTKAGAPFTGRLCRLVGERLDDSTALGARILNWGGNPSHEGDALPLRLMGGLHALARDGRDAAWSTVYPPSVTPADEALWALLNGVLAHHADFIAPWLDGPPQTNEVGRSAALMAGLLVLADRFGLGFDTYELGASAGLNSRLDHYAHDLGGVLTGDQASKVRLQPQWTGRAPPKAEVVIGQKHLVDLNPLDATDPQTQARLKAYVWADQLERLARLEAALEVAGRYPLAMAKADAADWLEQALSPAPVAGVCRVVMHTIAYQYFPPQAQDRIRQHLDTVGRLARPDAPLAWLSFEQSERGGAERRPLLELTVWTGEAEPVTQVLAQCQPHGAEIDWKL